MNMIEPLDFNKLMLQENYQEWGGNKSFKENIVIKLNEIIEVLNQLHS